MHVGILIVARDEFGSENETGPLVSDLDTTMTTAWVDPPPCSSGTIGT